MSVVLVILLYKGIVKRNTKWYKRRCIYNIVYTSFYNYIL
jgi:hypothetical protein